MHKVFLLQGFLCGFVLFVCLLESLTLAGESEIDYRSKNTIFIMATLASQASAFSDKEHENEARRLVHDASMLCSLKENCSGLFLLRNSGSNLKNLFLLSFTTKITWT
jgi:hypothetical protein